MKELFIRFLEKADAYDAFIEALKNHKSYTLESILGEPHETYIIRGFTWHNSPQGSDYWINLDSRWRTIIKRHGKENK